jgi:iron complex transport system substrate-binding protein
MTIRRFNPWVFATLAACMAAIAHPAAADDAGAAFTAISEAATTRIVSLGGDVTEILAALGYMDRIAAVDSTSKFPEVALETKANVGYLRALSTEGVLSVNPSAIIASDGAGPPDVVKALKGSSIPYLVVEDDAGPESVVAKVRHIGAAINAGDRAEKLAKSIEAEFAALAKEREQLKKAKRALIVLTVQNGRAIVGGAGSSADAILKLAGADNAAVGMDGFKPVSDEQLAQFAPDAIIVMGRVGEGAQKPVELVKALKGLQSSPAITANAVIQMDGLYLLGFGPRTPAAARDVMAAIYPERRAEKSDAAP